jgi:hypothetical protein
MESVSMRVSVSAGEAGGMSAMILDGCGGGAGKQGGVYEPAPISPSPGLAPRRQLIISQYNR